MLINPIIAKKIGEKKEEFDVIHQLTFEEASGTCNIRLYKGSHDAQSGIIYYRARTFGKWNELAVTGTTTKIPVSSTTMQIAHSWGKDENSNYLTPSFSHQSSNLIGIKMMINTPLEGIVGDNFMSYYAYGCSNLETLDVPNTSNITEVGDNFMSYYANRCSSLETLDVPDTSNITEVGNYFMYSYAQNCSNLETLSIPSISATVIVGAYFMVYYALDCPSLKKLILPKAGYFKNKNVDWSVPSSVEGTLKGYVIDEADLQDWKNLTTSGKTLYTNYIRNPNNVILL